MESKRLHKKKDLETFSPALKGEISTSSIILNEKWLEAKFQAIFHFSLVTLSKDYKAL